MSTILVAIDLEVLTVAHALRLGASRIPKATKIRRGGFYVLDMPDILSGFEIDWDLDEDASPRTIGKVISTNLPDPIYLEPMAPYRYCLLLRHYSKHIPSNARIRLGATTNAGHYYSEELEMSR